MAYMGIIPDAPSFGTQVARGLGEGISKGIGKSEVLRQQLKGKDPYRKLQQTRLALDSKYKQLSGFIKEADALLKNDSLYPFKPGEKEALKQQRDLVSDQRNQLFALNQALDSGEGEEEMHEEPKKKSKPKFMKSNKEHMAKFNQLSKQYGRDEGKIRKVLEKEFDLD